MFAGRPAERLREYLRTLQPEFRATLMAQLEGGGLCGEEAPLAGLLLHELRREARKSASAAPRISLAARTAFRPLEPFLLDCGPERRFPARIPRASLEPLWTWISRDLMADSVQSYAEQLARVQASHSPELVDRLGRLFQDRLVESAIAALAKANEDDRSRGRLSLQIGTPHGFDDASEMVRILKARDALSVIQSRIPSPIKTLSDEAGDLVKSVLDAPIARHAGVFPYALVLVQNQLVHRWQLVRLAVRAVQSDSAQRISESPFALAVSMVLDDLESLLAGLQDHVSRLEISDAISAVKAIHEAVRGFRSELDMPPDFIWSRRLAALRAEVSRLLTPELAPIPGRVRALLRSVPRGRVPAGAAVDMVELAEVSEMVDLLAVCRNCASELALNEVAQRACSELTTCLETGTSSLLEALRGAEGIERSFRQSQLDAAVRICARWFGPTYAGLLNKAVEVAGNGGERLAAQA